MQKYHTPIFIGSVVIMLAAVFYGMCQFTKDLESTFVVDEPAIGNGERVQNPEGSEKPTGKIGADMFTGKLEEVNTGCFADGECYVVVDGKHVTTLIGWTQTVVGSIQGVESFGDLEAHIGATVEVYAQTKPDGTYTLYDSEGFYVKLVGGADIDETPKPLVGAGCARAGCSSQLCMNAGEADGMVTNCMYMEEYACYDTARCEKQADGQCGWTESDALSQCLIEKRSGTLEVQ